MLERVSCPPFAISQDHHAPQNNLPELFSKPIHRAAQNLNTLCHRPYAYLPFEQIAVGQCLYPITKMCHQKMVAHPLSFEQIPCPYARRHPHTISYYLQQELRTLGDRPLLPNRQCESCERGDDRPSRLSERVMLDINRKRNNTFRKSSALQNCEMAD